MNKKKKHKILIVFVIGLFLVIYILFIQPKHNIDSSSNGILTSIKQTLIDNPINWLKNTTYLMFNSNSLLLENQKLKQDVLAIESYKVALEKKEQEIISLQQQLNLKQSLSNFKSVNSQIIQRQSRYFLQKVKIDVGKKDGIIKNNAVINGQGVLGIIDSVEDDYSNVNLLINNQNPVQLSIKIMTKNKQQVDAILDYYDMKKKSYKITLLENNQSVDVGDFIVTSGLSHQVPSGLLIGKINEVIKDETSLSLVLYATPSVNFNQLDYVMVVTK